MPYVSAKYAQPDPIAPPGAAKQVLAIDDQGAVWSLTEDSQVGDWLRFKEDGGEVTPYQPPQEPA